MISWLKEVGRLWSEAGRLLTKMWLLNWDAADLLTVRKIAQEVAPTAGEQEKPGQARQRRVLIQDES